jgi:hypothetical protein
LYRRSCLDQAGGYDVTLRERDAEGCEDWDIALKVAEKWRVAFVPSALVAYRRRSDSLSCRTDLMARSHARVLNSARQRRPEIRSTSIRSSHDQFTLYLAGVSFWSGAYRQAMRLGLRARRSGLVLEVLPYVVRLLWNASLRRSGPGLGPIRPGVVFSDWKMPEPMIPYDRIYERRLKRLNNE